jgi:RNA polymerase sigma-70 factor (ECF subfamily)
MWLNGAPAGRIRDRRRACCDDFVVENGRVTQIYVMRNPRKLTRLDRVAERAR